MPGALHASSSGRIVPQPKLDGIPAPGFAPCVLWVVFGAEKRRRRNWIRATVSVSSLSWVEPPPYSGRTTGKIPAVGAVTVLPAVRVTVCHGYQPGVLDPKDLAVAATTVPFAPE